MVFKLVLVSSLIFSMSSFANSPDCLSDLGDLFDGRGKLELEETTASDGQPLKLSLSNFSASTARIRSVGRKNGETFGLVTGTFSVSDCKESGSGLSFKMKSGIKSVSISVQGNSFRARAMGWSGAFRQTN